MDRVAAGDLPAWIALRTGVGHRFLFGLAGAPGSGKSTLAGALAHELGAPVVPMDGFHLPDAVLVDRGIRDVKGAPHTFDSDRFVETVRRLRSSDHDVSVPTFDRNTDEPVADSLVVRADRPIVIVEGNYLLLESTPWNALPALFDAIGHLAIDPAERVERLVERHVRHGKELAAARGFVARSDEPNAALVEAVAHRATVSIVGN